MPVAKDNAVQYPLLFEDGSSAVARATDAGPSASPNTMLDTEQDQVASRPASKSRVNPRFLQHLVRNVEGHNSALLRKEREERLSLRKHPLVDKIRAIEQRKLEAGKLKRKRSRSPRLTVDRRRSCDESGQDKQREPRTVRHEPVVRGRGNLRSNMLDIEDQDNANNTTPSRSIDAFDIIAHGQADPLDAQKNEISEHENTPNDSRSTSKAARDKAMAKTTIIEDDQGKWRCGAGYL